jgi:hypothetical protein
MSILSSSIRAAIASAALVAALSPMDALASNGLVVKLLDGSVPVNQPDLFANAYSKAWNPNAFCTALKAELAAIASNPDALVITSCSAPSYGVPSLVSHGSLGASVDFSAPVSLQGTYPWAISSPQGTKQVTCQFTDQIRLSVQDELTLSQSALPPKVPSVSFAPPTLKGVLSSETWSTHCTDTVGNHPGGVAALIMSVFPTAASSVNFPGSALNNALSPYQAVIEKDLVSMIYNVSVTTGDVDIQVTSSFLSQGNDKMKSALGQTAASGASTAGGTQGASTASSAWGAQPAPPTTGGASAAPSWGAPGSGSAINRSVGTSLQQARPQQTTAAPSSLGQPH